MLKATFISKFACHPEKARMLWPWKMLLLHGLVMPGRDLRRSIKELYPKDIAVIHAVGGDILVKVSRYTSHPLEGHQGMPS